jgi:methionyl-tRNA formyltransferase
MTGHRRGIASRCLPALCEASGVDVAAVVFVAGSARDPKRELRRKLRKVAKIGLAGALNGLRLRGWYADHASEDIEAVASVHGVPFLVTPSTNDDRTVELFRESRADLGLSLGNGYISERIFSVPRLGMLNCHGEVLPDFKGAQSVIWPIHEGVAETGFTIHRIARTIDGGPIVYREKVPIVFASSLRETVEASVDVIRRRIPGRLAYVCAEFESLLERSVEQEGGRSYTTPGMRAYLRMLRNHRRMAAAASRRGASRAEGAL